MKLTIIGCSGSAPGPASTAPCYLIEADGYRVVLDLGNGALGPLQRHVALHEIDAIVLSHLHADHCLDMTALSVVLRYGGGPLPRPIPVLGPPGTAERLATAYDPSATPAMFDGLFDFRVAADCELGPFGVRTAPMNHPVPTVGVRFDQGGRSITYSADTGYSPELIELARGTDVFLCEASWGGDAPPVPNLHLSGREAGEHASAAEVGRLFLTHIPPWIEIEPAVAAAMAAFSGEVVLMRADDSFEV
ncbi:MAG: fold metallo-hydrolase [Pseudonocardiales bacterium]|nr:fold metallo-hydrolase [Pseudonocardiales bacterium]